MVGTYLAVAVEHDVAEAREAAAAVVHQHRILSVADHTNLRHVGYGVEVARVALRLHLAVAVALVLRHLEVYVGLHLGFLLEQRFHALHGRFLHEATLQAVVAEIVGQRCQYHTLMVGVVGLHRHMVLVVVALVEAELVVHAQLLEALHVVVDGAVVDTDGHQRTVGRDDDTVGRGVLELEVRHTKSVVLVVLRVVELVVGRFGDAPRHIAVATVAHKGALGADGETVGLIHQRVFVGGQEDERHKVFEQSAVPRRHALVALVLHQRLVEAEPMLVGGVALGDGEEGSQARLAGEVVVVVGQKRIVGGIIADTEHIQLGVVELHEVRLVDKTLHLCKERLRGRGARFSCQPTLHHI